MAYGYGKKSNPKKTGGARKASKGKGYGKGKKPGKQLEKQTLVRRPYARM